MKKIFIASIVLASLSACNVIEKAKKISENSKEIANLSLSKLQKKDLKNLIKNDSLNFNGKMQLNTYNLNAKKINSFYDENWNKKVSNIFVNTYYYDKSNNEIAKGGMQCLTWEVPSDKRQIELYNFVGKNKAFLLQYYESDSAKVWDYRSYIFKKVFNTPKENKLMKREWRYNDDEIIIDSGYSSNPYKRIFKP